MERRWSSIRQDGFKTRCQSLWVGPKVVYRVTIETTITLDQENDVSWVAAISKEKLKKFHDQLVQLNKAVICSPRDKNRICEFEILVGRGMSESKTMVLLYEEMSEPTNQRNAMENFISGLLRDFGLLTSMSVDSVQPSILTNEMLRFYTLLRNFLMIPNNVQDARNKLAAAVMSLEDIDPQYQNLDGCCCICLELWTDTSHPSVKLPCLHAFHEDCVMLWIRKSSKCPICRAFIGKSLMS